MGYPESQKVYTPYLVYRRDIDSVGLVVECDSIGLALVTQKRERKLWYADK